MLDRRMRHHEHLPVVGADRVHQPEALVEIG
jgi:hypothetical protein